MQANAAYKKVVMTTQLGSLDRELALPRTRSMFRKQRPAQAIGAPPIHINVNCKRVEPTKTEYILLYETSIPIATVIRYNQCHDTNTDEPEQDMKQSKM